jgi:hypothetical protein
MPFISSIRSVYGPIGRMGRIIGAKDAITGGIISSAGGYRIHTFTDVGTSYFNMSMVASALNIEYLIIAGGGSGGYYGGMNPGSPGSTYWGGGGAGGYRTGTIPSSPANYPVVVGAGGYNYSSTNWSNGLNSSFNGVSSVGGGTSGGSQPSGQGGPTGPEVLPQIGGSGAGGYIAKTPGSGTSGQGSAGGTSTSSGTNGGGGGGAGGVGANGIDQAAGVLTNGYGGIGGAGMSSSINGSSITRASGGGGGGVRNNRDAAYPGTIQSSTPGGGGRGFSTNANIWPPGSYGGAEYRAYKGTPNTGGGGGGGMWDGWDYYYIDGSSNFVAGPTSTLTGNEGGSGIIILRYTFP